MGPPKCITAIKLVAQQQAGTHNSSYFAKNRESARYVMMHCFWLSRVQTLQNKADGMIKHLASLSEDRLIISFAPKTLAYSILKRIGELFPGPSKVNY